MQKCTLCGNEYEPTPFKEFEEVEVVRYFCNNCKQSQSSEGECCNEKLIKLTGTIKREIKPKVKHRELIAECDKFGYVSGSFVPRRPNSKIWSSWDE